MKFGLIFFVAILVSAVPSWGEKEYGTAQLSDEMFFGSEKPISNFTICVWVKFYHFNNNYPIIAISENYHIVLHGMGPVYGAKQGHIAFYQQKSRNYTAASRSGFIVSKSKLVKDRWHFLSVTREAGAVKMYIDGILDTALSNQSPLAVTDKSVFLGANVPGGSEEATWLHGRLDDFQVFGEALSPFMVRRLYELSKK